MANLKYSRQRESIKTYLNNTFEHPTADTVYDHVREEYPNISLGTVYRNLNLLADIGEAVKLTAPDGADRFDANTNPHNHFYCMNCHRVIDLEMESIEHITEIASKNFDGIIRSHTTTFFGTCGDCLKNNSN